jgi:molybdate-binding protein/DNA-binding XRE family transcriptional regulator
MLPGGRQLRNRVKAFRQERGWSQDDLARRSGISRAAVSAIEIGRLAPSVESALALAAVFACRVDDLFALAGGATDRREWAWAPTCDPCRYWSARVGERLVAIPVEATAQGTIPHDGVFENGTFRDRGESLAESTLVITSCDPAAGLLAAEYSRKSGFRLLVLPRSSRQGLDLLGRGLVDVAGLHLASADNDSGNSTAVSQALEGHYSLLTVARWQAGVALGAGVTAKSVSAALGARVRWVGRETGSGARQCQDQLFHDTPPPRRTVGDHRGVAAAVRHGWADAGICVRLVAEEAGLHFLPVRDEAYDLCFPTALENDPRVRALIQVVRSGSFRENLADLPGYDSGRGGSVVAVR